MGTLCTGLTATDKTEACADTSLGIFLTVLLADDWMGHCWAKGHTLPGFTLPKDWTYLSDSSESLPGQSWVAPLLQPDLAWAQAWLEPEEQAHGKLSEELCFLGPGSVLPPLPSFTWWLSSQAPNLASESGH